MSFCLLGEEIWKRLNEVTISNVGKWIIKNIVNTSEKTITEKME
jgi:hypothetical protein